VADPPGPLSDLNVEFRHMTLVRKARFAINEFCPFSRVTFLWSATEYFALSSDAHRGNSPENPSLMELTRPLAIP
jgi:hypothetical protein